MVLVGHRQVEHRHAVAPGEVVGLHFFTDQHVGQTAIVVVVVTVAFARFAGVFVVLRVTVPAEVEEQIVFVKPRNFDGHFGQIHDVDAHVAVAIGRQVNGFSVRKRDAGGHLAKEHVLRLRLREFGPEYAAQLLVERERVSIAFVEIAAQNKTVFGRFGAGLELRKYGRWRFDRVAQTVVARFWLRCRAVEPVTAFERLRAQFLRGDDADEALTILKTRLNVNDFQRKRTG